jgi:membrane dipeptidase
MPLIGSLAILVLGWVQAPTRAADRTLTEAAKVADRALARAIIIDTHADTPQMMLDDGCDLADPNSPLMVSIPKARAGHLGGEFMSIWVDVDWPHDDLIHRALDLIDAVDEQVARHPADLALAVTADDVVRIHRRGKIAILKGVEGGHIIEGDLHVLDMYYRLGARYMTLTHTKNNDIGDSSGDQPHWKGLSEFGRQVVARMNRLGMMVDISHVSDDTFYAAVAASKAPVIASHSSCRALCNAPRNMTDDMLRAVARNGGVVDINFYDAFLDQNFADAYRKVEPAIDAAVKAARDQYARQGKRLTDTEEAQIDEKFYAGLPVPSYTRIADHIDHAVQVAGIDHVGLGSDFDGISGLAPRGMEDCSKFPNLVRELARRGYSEADIEKILGGNVLRVMRQAELISQRMQAGEIVATNDQFGSEKVYDAGAKVTAPEVIYKPEPRPSHGERKVKEEATCRLIIVVDARGDVVGVRFIKAVGQGLDEKAVDAVKTWRFKPAMRNGLSVPARLMVHINFKLFDQEQQGRDLSHKT